MTVTRKMRSPEDYARFKLALVSVDQAFFESEQRWGVGRLERLVSHRPAPHTSAAGQPTGRRLKPATRTGWKPSARKWSRRSP